MAQKTKQQLKDTLVDWHLVTGGDFTDLVDSLKGLQAPFSVLPTPSGVATAFITGFTQNEEGVISNVVVKSVDFSGYQTVAGMMNYQTNDMQIVGNLPAASSITVNHNKGHYPTVRLLDSSSGQEVRPTQNKPEPYIVWHDSVNSLRISNLMESGTYQYILD
ncbi:MAG: hypothetical protein IKV77_12975 [Alistipes sp.]|nr:hypothetical protein [Bacteroidales bacterium]MBR5492518.1 hypothetical protein [Alistipes sp.]MBR5494019.1 hypothetical protein [Alistipes sp.]MBR5920081.1 hypothetical protein [Bacteroidales bacterium]